MPLARPPQPCMLWLSCRSAWLKDLEVMQELCSATDYTLWAMKVKVQALGRVMSMLVVQECHLWLNLAEMLVVEKILFLDAPFSQGGLIGDTVEDFLQQFSAVK